MQGQSYVEGTSMTPRMLQSDEQKITLPKKGDILPITIAITPYTACMGIKEHRLAHFKSNLHEWRHRVVDDYVDLPREKRNPVDRATHTFGAALSTFMEAPDALFEKLTRGIDDKQTTVEPLKGEAARTRRNLNTLFAEPGLASKAAALIRLPGDVVMDAFDFGIGNHH